MGRGPLRTAFSPFATEYRAATAPLAAVAGVRMLDRRRVRLIENQVVVIGQLFARPDAAGRLDENPAFLIDRLAIRRARMVKPAHRTAATGRVDHRLVIDCEQHGVGGILLLLAVALIGLFVADALAGILDQAAALGNIREREYAAPVNG